MVTTPGSMYTQLWSLPDASGQGNAAQGDGGIWKQTSSARGSVYKMPARPGFDAPFEPKPQKGMGGPLGFVGDVFIGAGEAVADTIVGAVNVVLHPIETVKNLVMLPVTLVTRPGALVAAFTEPFTTAIKEGRPGKAIGRGLAEVGMIVFGPKLIDKGLSKLRGGAINAANAAEHGAKLAEKLGKQAAKAADQAKRLAAASHTGEAAKMSQYARILDRSAALAATGEVEKVTRAAKYARWATNAKTVKVATETGKLTMSMPELMTRAEGLLTEASAMVAKQAPKAKKAATAVRQAAKKKAPAQVSKAAKKRAPRASTKTPPAPKTAATPKATPTPKPAAPKPTAAPVAKPTPKPSVVPVSKPPVKPKVSVTPKPSALPERAQRYAELSEEASRRATALYKAGHRKEARLVRELSNGAAEAKRLFLGGDAAAASRTFDGTMQFEGIREAFAHGGRLPSP